jgi:hypothetical protein
VREVEKNVLNYFLFSISGLVILETPILKALFMLYMDDFIPSLLHNFHKCTLFIVLNLQFIANSYARSMQVV